MKSLYTNINQQEGIDACRRILEKHSSDKIKNNFILELLSLILKHNIFEFDSKLYRQVIGTAMGSKPAPDYANIFMAEIDEQILNLASSKFPSTLKIKFYRRFLDDIFIVLRATTSAIHKFMDSVNKMNDSIKFTIQHTTPYNIECETCDQCEFEAVNSIPFLDTQCTIKNNKIIIDLYKKPTDRNMYLLTSSCHPAHVTSNIPFSLALRIVRICTESESRD